MSRLVSRLPAMGLTAPRIMHRSPLTGAASYAGSWAPSALSSSSALAAATMRGSGGGLATQRRMQHDGGNTINVKYPVVQLPARNLWCRQGDVSIEDTKNGVFSSLFDTLRETRKFYQYPSLSAPQIGWNVRAFTLFDDAVFVNAEIISVSTEECWAWEPCASCPFMMHYIKRPKEVRLRYSTLQGEQRTEMFSKMRARFILHEMDHLDGILFTRRIPDTQHVVPLDGFNSMSDWPDDYPSLEARSTFLYSTFTPPYYFETDEVLDANLLDRKFEDCIYPGYEHDAAIRINTEAQMEQQRDRWAAEKEERDAASAGEEASTMKDLPLLEEETAAETA